MKRLYSILLAIILPICFMGCEMKSLFLKDKLYGEFEIWAYGEYYNFISDSALQFMDEHPFVKINVKLVDGDKYIDNYKGMISSADVPYAMVLRDSDFFRTKISSEIKYEKLNDLINFDELFTKPRLETARIGSDIYGLPIESNPLVCLLDKEKIEQYGYSIEDFITWNDVLTIGKDVYSKSNGKDILIRTNNEGEKRLRSILVKQLKIDDDTFYLSKYNSTIFTMEAIIKELKDNNVLYVDNKSDNLGILNIMTYGEARSIKDAEKKFDVKNMIAMHDGGNCFISEEGTSIYVGENFKDNEVLDEFLKYMVTDISAIYGLKKYNIFPSVITSYDKKYFDTQFEQFDNDRILSRLSNIAINEDYIEGISEIYQYIDENN